MTQIQQDTGTNGNTIVCSECGSVNYEGDKYCAVCGAKLPTQFDFEEQAEPIHVETDSNVRFHTHLQRTDHSYERRPVSSDKSDGFAIAGFVLSIISAFGGSLVIFPVVLSMIFSIMGLNNTNKNGTKGHGLAAAGLIISVVMLILTVILYLGIFAWNW